VQKHLNKPILQNSSLLLGPIPNRNGIGPGFDDLSYLPEGTDCARDSQCISRLAGGMRVDGLHWAIPWPSYSWSFANGRFRPILYTSEPQNLRIFEGSLPCTTPGSNPFCKTPVISQHAAGCASGRGRFMAPLQNRPPYQRLFLRPSTRQSRRQYRQLRRRWLCRCRGRWPFPWPLRP